MITIPIIGFFTFFADSSRKLGSFLRRPHLLALVAAVLVVAFGIAVVIRTNGEGEFLAMVAYMVLGVTMSVPGGPIVYLVSLFFGTLLIGCLILPSKRWSPDENSRRIGLGLAFIWIAGLQPYRVYQFALMLTGFVILALGMSMENSRAKAADRESLLNLMKELDGDQNTEGSENERTK